LDNITAYGFVIPTEVEESQLPGWVLYHL